MDIIEGLMKDLENRVSELDDDTIEKLRLECIRTETKLANWPWSRNFSDIVSAVADSEHDRRTDHGKL